MNSQQVEHTHDQSIYLEIENDLKSQSQPFLDSQLMGRLFIEYISCCFLAYNCMNATCVFAGQLTVFFCVLFSLKISGSHFHYHVTMILMFRPHSQLDRKTGILQIIAGFLGICTGQLVNYAMFGKFNPLMLQSYEQNYILMAFALQTFGTFAFQFLNIFLFEPHTAPTQDPVQFVFLIQWAVLLGVKLGTLSNGITIAILQGVINPTIAFASVVTSTLVGDQNYIFTYDTLFHQTTTLIGSLGAFILYYGYVWKQEKFSFDNYSKLIRNILQAP